MAQLPKHVHRSPMWHMKDNGQGYLFLVKRSLLIIVLVKALEAVEFGGKSPFFKYLSTIFNRPGVAGAVIQTPS